MKPIAILLAISLVSTSACTFGKNAARLPLAQQPFGASMKITTTTSAAYSGELLEIGDDGLTMRQMQGKIMFVPFTVLRDFSVNDLGSRYSSNRSGKPAPEMLQRLKAVSHFPQGIPPEIRQRLLAQTQQAEVIVAQ